MIAAEAVTKQRGGRAVVSHVTFRCEPGTITGFLGPPGAGKTTTMRSVVGISQDVRAMTCLTCESLAAGGSPGSRAADVLLVTRPGRSFGPAAAVYTTKP